MHHPALPLFPGFAHHQIAVSAGLHISAMVGGQGPGLLLLHGHPQTLAIWHKVAPTLAQHFTVVAADLRGYGDSSKPEGGPGHAAYAKRRLAQDQIDLMQHLGFARFHVLAHDRGARVAHRLGMDHPQAVCQMVLLDIAPTLAMYAQTTEAFARAYWHWFFLIQPQPMPERLIQADPAAYVTEVMGNRSAGLAPFDARALAEYQRCLALPGAAHGLCEDYRASAGIDLEHDREDIAQGRRLQMPIQVLWGAQGVVQRCFEPLKEWQKVASQVTGQALPCGHYIAEEAPDALLAQVLPFLDKAPRMSQHNRRGIVTMTGAMVFFVVNDALVKWVSADLSTPQLIFVRGVMTTALLLALAGWMGQLQLWRTTLTRSVPARAMLDSLASFTYLTALFHMPLGNATAINLAGPLFLTLMAVFFLHERVSPGRWALIVLGFAGVLLVVQPRMGDFNAYAWLCLFAAVLHAGRDFLTRLVPAQVPSLLITLSTATMVTLMAGVWSLFEPWKPMSTPHLWLLFGASLCLAAGYHLLTLSMRLGDMSVIGPFRYSGLLVALVLGYLMWGDVPNTLAWCGIALVVAAGLGLLQAERLRRQALLAQDA